MDKIQVDSSSGQDAYEFFGNDKEKGSGESDGAECPLPTKNTFGQDDQKRKDAVEPKAEPEIDLEPEPVEAPRKSFGPGLDDEIWLVYAPKSANFNRLVSAQISLGSNTDSSTETAQIICNTKLYPKERPIEMTTETDEKRQMEAVGAIKVRKSNGH